MTITFDPIGTIFTPFTQIQGMPIQPTGAIGVEGQIVIKPEFAAGLQDLDGFSHLVLLYHFHQAKTFNLVVTPFLDTRQHGVFATRAPKRPTPIGLSVVELVALNGNTLHVKNIDVLNETPLLDIKPYVAEFDSPPATRFGWLEKAHGQVKHKQADERFK